MLMLTLPRALPWAITCKPFGLCVEALFGSGIFSRPLRDAKTQRRDVGTSKYEEVVGRFRGFLAWRLVTHG